MPRLPLSASVAAQGPRDPQMMIIKAAGAFEVSLVIVSKHRMADGGAGDRSSVG